MTSSEQLNRLRLAARTLIEWKAPSSSESYKAVLSGLLQYHPVAARWGLKIKSRVFLLDTQGVILWYLSDTLNAQVGTFNNAVGVQEDKIQALETSRYVHDLMRSFFLRNYLSKDREELWPRGPSKSQIYNIIIDRLFTDPVSLLDKSLQVRAYEALFSLLVPFEPDLQREIISDLLQTSPSTRFQRLSRFLENSTHGTLIVQIVVGFIIGIIGILGPDRLNSFNSWLIFLLIAVVPILTALSKTYRQILYEVIRRATLGSSRILKIEREIKLSKLSAEGIYRLVVITFMSSRNATSLVKNGREEYWMYPFSVPERMISEDVVSNIIPLLEDPNISWNRKAKIFKWLCGLEVKYNFIESEQKFLVFKRD